MGEKHRQAAQRRSWTKREAERRQEESRVHWVANVQRRGFFGGRGNFVTE